VSEPGSTSAADHATAALHIRDPAARRAYIDALPPGLANKVNRLILAALGHRPPDRSTSREERS
jgi:hypothetical protein